MFRLTIFLANALSKSAVLAPFVKGNALKVIAGINQFDATIVKNVVAAACQSGATLVDIACDASLVRMAKTVSGEMPICVSSIKPLDFVAAVEAGASMVEIGNFDGFYEQGMKFTAEDVVAMTIETRRLLPNIPLSVTVPHTLPLNEQVELAVRLQQCGADIIQTEGKMSVNPASMGVQELIEKAAPTIARYPSNNPTYHITLQPYNPPYQVILLAAPFNPPPYQYPTPTHTSAYALSRAVTIPVMCASGLTDVTAPLALAAGARGVGIGSMVNKLPNRQQMLLAVQAVATAMGRESSPQQQVTTLIKTP